LIILGCAKDAITKAESAYEKRFDNTNQRKQTFSKLSGNMVTRMEYWSAYEALKDKIEELSIMGYMLSPLGLTVPAERAQQGTPGC
jgi:hypothetical protein